MSVEQVESILGRPYQMTAAPKAHVFACKTPRTDSIKFDNQKGLRSILDNFYGDTAYCCEGYKENLQNNLTTLTYTQRSIFSHPMLWVDLDSTYKVDRVCVRIYGFLDFFEPAQMYIYLLSWGRDEKTLEMKHEKPEYFVDEGLFSKYFK
jgi:hypothetical protein